ncbi:hypothetical protein [Phytoactinopolyspora limicola]|uniref:hypothetical protein n=1 Tax=Phytoactinopolyspora limicola TaxID=2715536 RepID=UPI00140C56E0|nr:hypothetical protein [Phytoactinopolyspora limicola]
MTKSLYLPSADDVRHHLTAARDAGALPDCSLHVLVGDVHGFASIAIFVDEVPPDPPLAERIHVLQSSLRALADVMTVHSVLMAISRSGPDPTQRGDVDWSDAFGSATMAAGITSHGVYLVTPGQVGRIDRPTAQAA